MTVDTESRLSPRELQCLGLLALGHSNDGIAKEIGIRPPTVAMHLANARAKLKAITREHAVAIAVSRGLIRI
ncbi:MAG: response regulator transcription factor [Hyphomicrobium sp.]